MCITLARRGHVQSIPEKDLQGFCFQDSHIALSTHFSWQVEYGRHDSGNLVNIFLEYNLGFNNSIFIKNKKI